MTTFVDNQTLITAAWCNKLETAIPDTGGLVLPKTSGLGIKVDTTTPTYAWADMLGPLYPDAAGANAPTLAAFRGGSVRRWHFTTGDKVDCEFHIPHDYAPGTDLYLHMHWSHNGTNISGTITATCAVAYAKGHSGGVFGAEVSVPLTQSSLNFTDVPQYSHEIVEAQLSSAGGAGGLLNSSDIEVDGVIGVNLTLTTAPTITGGTGEPFIFFIDIHYQTTNVGTKNKSPSFYG